MHPRKHFVTKAGFLRGKVSMNSFLGLHKAFNFLGMEPLKTFVCFDVMSHPLLDIDKQRVQRHLEACGF